MFRKEIILSLSGVEREYRAARLAVADLLARSATDPSMLFREALNGADVRACRANSEVTYLVRMFAVFEEALREARRIVYRKNSAIKTYDLLQQCAAREGIPDQILANAHIVREFRNSIVHGGDAPPVTLPQARSRLCDFLGRMPPKW